MLFSMNTTETNMFLKCFSLRLKYLQAKAKKRMTKSTHTIISKGFSVFATSKPKKRMKKSTHTIISKRFSAIRYNQGGRHELVLSNYVSALKVLSSEMDLAKSRLIRKVLTKGRGA